tara:strand:+ start:627 stop:1331 length:705 start_codon:yes stop_codon:yes gene_type:complete
MQTALLDNVAHGDLRLRRAYGAQYGDPAGQVEILLPEIPQIQREFPILFSRNSEGALRPLAILGLEPQELLFTRDGEWDARYVPSLIQKGPFLLGASDSDDPVVHIVLDHPKLTQDPQASDPLFRPHGGHAPALENALDALRMVHTGLENTRRMTKALDEAGLIRPLAIDVQVSDTKSVKFDNFHAVLPEAVQDLPEEKLVALNRLGFLQPAMLIAHSLGNMNDLVKRKRMREN